MFNNVKTITKLNKILIDSLTKPTITPQTQTIILQYIKKHPKTINAKFYLPMATNKK
jgi:hypothetical protein